MLQLHAHDDHLASADQGGAVRIWSLARRATVRQWQWGACAVHIDERRAMCGGEGAQPVCVYDWRDGTRLCALPNAEPPVGVCSALQRRGRTLAAGNTFSHSQVMLCSARASRAPKRRA